MTDTTDKTRRHRTILQLLAATPIASQDDLAAKLAAGGIRVTQSTLSRDLKELRVTRVSTGVSYRYLPSGGNGGPHTATPPEELRRLAASEVTGIDANEVAVAVHTLSGRAQGVAVYIDSLAIPEILATLAGDDTVIVYPNRIKQTARLRQRLASLLSVA
ncbi:MAG: arginine repressor [Gemmatimonadales bacterium]|jgi:transcriptional regulator of arginine metabolism|nr:MAG: arginine repressor [Gemmatimonadales bacterium]